MEHASSPPRYGSDEATGSLLYVDLEERIPARYPLRKIRSVVNDALRSLDGEFDRLYVGEGRSSIGPGAADPGQPGSDTLFNSIRAAAYGTDGL